MHRVIRSVSSMITDACLAAITSYKIGPGTEAVAQLRRPQVTWQLHSCVVADLFDAVDKIRICE